LHILPYASAPRPDLSVKFGTPNACNDCHKDKTAQWAAAAVESWFGPHREGFQHYADTFHAAWTDQSNAEKLLAAIATDDSNAAFARASAFNALNAYASHVGVQLARRGLSDPDPIVRVGALDMLAGIPARLLWPVVSPLFSDSILGVRIKAAALLAAVPTDNQPAADRKRFENAAAEFVAAQKFNAERPEARAALGTFYAQRGRVAQAEAELKAALHLSSQFVPAAINLADLYRELGRDSDGIDVLRRTLLVSPQDASLHYALGLALVRLKQNNDALSQLRRAAELAPDQPRYAYVYAVGLNSMGRSSEAIAVLKQSLLRHPFDRDTLMALIIFNRDAHDRASALYSVERLVKAIPSDDQAKKLLEDLRQRKQ
jgi:Flp pilus assembly protein TadD